MGAEKKTDRYQTTLKILKDSRPSIERGWYPQNPGKLTRSLELYLDSAEVKKPEGELQGIIVPHAGHVYSGSVAAHAFKCLSGTNFETVVIVSPSHYHYDDIIVTTSHSSYETPLGTVMVDHSLIEKLNNKLVDKLGKNLKYVDYDSEHAIEVELPFLQHIMGQFKLLPLMIVEQTIDIAKELGHSIAEVVSDRRALMVASSDLSHFYSEKIANGLDGEMLGRIESFDPRGVIEAEENGTGFACGRAAISSVLWACLDLGANNIKVLKYATSGTVTGDYDEVVGYGSAVIWKT